MFLLLLLTHILYLITYTFTFISYFHYFLVNLPFFIFLATIDRELQVTDVSSSVNFEATISLVRIDREIEQEIDGK